MEGGRARAGDDQHTTGSPRLKQSWPTRLVLLLSGRHFATARLTFADGEHLPRLRGVFAANGWSVDATDERSETTVVRLHRMFKDSTDAGSPSSIERELRAMASGIPNRLVECVVTLAIASAPTAPDRLESTDEYDGARLLRTRLTATYPPPVAGGDEGGVSPERSDARPRADRVGRGIPGLGTRGEDARTVRIRLVLCAWSTLVFALLPTQVLPEGLVRGVDIVIPVVAVAVVLVGVLVWFAAHCLQSAAWRRSGASSRAHSGGRMLDLVEIAAVGAVFGLGIGEVYAYYAADPDGVPHIFLVIVTVLLLILIALAVSAVTVAVRVLRSRTPGIVLGAALILGMAAGVVRLPSWAYFSGMGVSMFSADLDWPSAVLLAVPFFVACAAAALVLGVAWVVRRIVPSTGTRLALQSACVAAVVVSLVSSLAASFVDGRDVLSTQTTASDWAGFPHPICFASPADPDRSEPYWLVVSPGSGIVVVRRHVPGVVTDPSHVVVEHHLYPPRGLRFVAETNDCTAF